jgi:AraC-like DNA-binding protein
MEKFIMTLSERAEPIDPRARVIASLLSDPQASVAGVATSVGLSARGLRGFVSRMAGMSPKRFVRIRRLHRALAAGLPNPRTGWSMPALSAGFVDQSHLVHDCKALLGESPTRFARRRLA